MYEVPDAEASLVISAGPGELYELVSDVTQMGRWSPENVGGRWLGKAREPAVGVRFRGTNRAGWRHWSTLCTVTESEPGRRFSFAVRFGPLPISEWSYSFEPVDGGCRVVEQWWDRRPGWLRLTSPIAMGVIDRAAHNRRGMQATLAALKTAAEAS